MPDQRMNYKNFSDLLDGDFPDFRLQLSKFASENKELPYVYAGHFADYITALILKEPENDQVKRFFKVLNEAF
jgi:hypothetical protein